MKTALKYKLADSTVAEPLVDQWPAWSQLISPATASLHLLRHQVPTLESYLEDPALHARLARDPKYAGSPFSDVPPHRADEMKELLARIREKRHANLEFARAINEFHNRLIDEANGLPLESYYEQMPEPLRGYAELVYDYDHNPSIRFLESLLYESEYYDRSLQSLRLFQLRRDPRPFFMSTPRLKDEDELETSIPFESPQIDELFRLDLEPQPLDRIREILQLSPADDHLLLPLLSAEPVSLPERWSERRVRVKYFGHACMLVEWNGVSILTDPYVPARPSEGGLGRFSYNDLPARIDFALVTHNHQDHFALETLLRLRPRIQCLVVPRSYGVLSGDISLKLLARKVGFKQVLELDTLESIPLPDGEIIGIPFYGEHGDLAHGKIAFLVRAGKERMLFAADSDCLDRRMYERICRVLGPIENVFLGTESVGAPLTWHNGALFCRRPTREQDQARRYHGCNAHTALQLLEAVDARRVYNYAMGKEPWLEHLLGLGTGEDSPQLRESRKMIAQARGRGFQVAERPFGKGEIYLGDPQNEASTGDLNQRRMDCFTLSHIDSTPAVKLEQQLANWRDQLLSSLPTLALPENQASESVFSPARQSVAFSRHLSDALAEFSRRQGHGLSVLLLAALQTLLYHYTGEEEIIIGARVGQLNNSETAGAPGGLLSHTLVLHTDLSGEPDFLRLLERVSGVIRIALKHNEARFEILVEALGLSADSVRARKLLPVMFRFGDESSQPSSATTSSPAQIRRRAEETEPSTRCDLALILSESEQGIGGYWQYDAGSFTASTIAAISEQYQVLLESAIENPEQTIMELPLVRPGFRLDTATAALANVEDLEDQFAF